MGLPRNRTFARRVDMPVVAIARCSKLEDYEASVILAGGTPWVVDRQSAFLGDVVSVANGLLLTGGRSVHPSMYDDASLSSSGAGRGRDEYEIELVRRVLDADLPVFAIGRGAHILNVARGGTLIQDIPTEVADSLEHRFPVPPYEPFTLAHDVWVEEGSLLAKLTSGHFNGADNYRVNSRHRQALKALGAGLVTAATASDDVTEAVEEPAGRFCLGVQWHPENFHRTEEFRSLFEGFVQACST